MYKEYSNVYVNSHPLVQHKISMLRNKNTGTNRDTYRNMYDTYDCRKEVSNCSCFKSWPGNGKRYYRTYS